MQKVIPYEHRGARYRAIAIRSQSDANVAAACYRAEYDVWLKKILASKLIEAASTYAFDIPVDELNEVLQCRTR